MATRTEAEWMGLLDVEAQEVYLGWKRLGYDAQRAMNEVVRAGLLDTRDGTPVVIRGERRPGS